MEPGVFETCVYCPNLCRHVCPVAVATGRESAVPTRVVRTTWLGLVSEPGDPDREERIALATEAASMCTGCGACTEACKLNRPVVDLLAWARRALSPPDTPPLPQLHLSGEGAADYVAVETGGEPWAGLLAQHLGKPVDTAVAPHHLGELLLDDPDRFQEHAEGLLALFGERRVVVADHGALRAGVAAALDVVHLSELVPAVAEDRTQAFHPCRGPHGESPAHPEQLACCGAAQPLAHSHPTVADEVAADAAARLGDAALTCTDARCAAALRSHGADVLDPIAILRERAPG